MQHLDSFFSHIRPFVLKPFLMNFHSAFDCIDWDQKTDLLKSSLKETMSFISQTIRSEIQNSIERIERMNDDYSQRLLIRLYNSNAELALLISSLERGCWVFTNDIRTFNYVEEMCAANDHKSNQYWSHYLVEPNSQALICDAVMVEKFTTAIEESLGLLNDKVKVVFFEKLYVDECGKEKLESHFTIYHSQLSEHRLFFNDHNCLSSNLNCKVLEYRIIYNAAIGEITIHAPDELQRSMIGHLFANMFLQQKNIILKQFNLLPLLKDKSLMWDSNDGIESIDVTHLALQDIAWNNCLYIDIPPKTEDQCTIYEYMESNFGTHNPLLSEQFIPVKATILINFHFNRCVASKKKIAISLISPNQCDMYQYSTKDRLLGEKYLKSWGISKDSV